MVRAFFASVTQSESARVRRSIAVFRCNATVRQCVGITGGFLQEGSKVRHGTRGKTDGIVDDARPARGQRVP